MGGRVLIAARNTRMVTLAEACTSWWASVVFVACVCDRINKVLEGSKVKETSSCVSLCWSRWENGALCVHVKGLR